MREQASRKYLGTSHRKRRISSDLRRVRRNNGRQFEVGGKHCVVRKRIPQGNHLTEESTIKPDASAGKWISYRIIYGIGIGLAFQPPFIAVQTVLEDSTVPAALVLLKFFQMLSDIIVISVAQNVSYPTFGCLWELHIALVLLFLLVDNLHWALWLGICHRFARPSLCSQVSWFYLEIIGLTHPRL
jgi:hypothetical protein